jgi:hypothetical protein
MQLAEELADKDGAFGLLGEEIACMSSNSVRLPPA